MKFEWIFTGIIYGCFFVAGLSMIQINVVTQSDLTLLLLGTIFVYGTPFAAIFYIFNEWRLKQQKAVG